MITENKNENGLNNIRVLHPSMVQERTKQDICGKGKEQENAGQGGCRTGGCILHAGLKDAGQEKAEQKDAGQDGFRQCCGSKYIKFGSGSGVILSILKEKFKIILEKIIFLKQVYFLN